MCPPTETYLRPNIFCDRDLKPSPYIANRRALIIPPGESVLIDVDVISCQIALEGWFEPCSDSLPGGLQVSEGPIELGGEKD